MLPAFSTDKWHFCIIFAKIIKKYKVAMKTGILPFLLSVFAVNAILAQNNSALLDYYNARIDAAVEAARERTEDLEEDKTNHVYAKMFTTPVLYSSVIERAFGMAERHSWDTGGEMAMDEKRSEVIDGIMLNMYKSSPRMVKMTEEKLREEKVVAGKLMLSAPVLKTVEPKMPDNVVGGMKTTVVKPKYWKFWGKVAMKFTQNYISGNWFQGGESNKTMLAEIDLNLDYDDKDRISFVNHMDIDLGFATTKADTLHSFRTNTDRLRLESTFGYKLVKNLDLAAKMKLESQMLPNYPINTHSFVSKFMAPFDANFSFGLNYKPSWEKFRLEVYLAPLSAYNYRFVRYGELASRYGIREGRHHKEDFGTQLVVTVPTVRILDIVNFWSKAEYYTNYSRAFFHWETKFDVELNKYFSVSLNMHARFDDSAPGLYDADYGYWQFKELMTLGVSYSW